MTLSLENLDLTVNEKHGKQTVLTYAQYFASSTKESVKESVSYLTSKEVWYSLPENKMKLEELKFPKQKNKKKKKRKNQRYYRRTKIEKCESGHHQMVLLFAKEVEGRKLQWQGTKL